MKNETGAITWCDLTVKDATEVMEFYSKVAGWKSEPVSMGDYDDFSMNMPDSGTTVAGICHARGGNKDLPPQWLIYITVEDVTESARLCTELGGEILKKPFKMTGYGEFCVIRDPAGAVAALFTPEQK